MGYLAQREEKAFEKSARFVKTLFERHIEMIIELFVLGDIIAYFVEEDEIHKTKMSRGQPMEYRCA